jgi:AcrR family transcriptional regulator
MIVDRGRIAALLAAGMTVRDVAKEIGISKSAVVHRMTRRSGLVAALAAGFKRLGVAGL